MADEPQQPQTLTIDGKQYNVADLSENARDQVVNLRVTDEEVANLKRKLAIAETARIAYAQALSKELPEEGH